MKNKKIKKFIKKKYIAGFTTNIPTTTICRGINENSIQLIIKKKEEPHFLTNFRIAAYQYWITQKEPKWGSFKKNNINYNNIILYSAPLKNSTTKIDQKLQKTYVKLGLPINEQKKLSGIAIDAVFDSVSVITTFEKKLESLGIIFNSISTTIKKYPNLLKKYLASIVPYTDNFFVSLNSAVFSDGSFCYIPPNVKCPLDLSTYFRINGILTGQFERTLIIADKNSFVNYLEGCTAPIRNKNQLHAAVVELIAFDNAKINYSTIQNWYPGSTKGIGGIYNFVTKRGLCFGKKSSITWTQIETGSSITWKYPSLILKGDYTKGLFYSITLTNNVQQADTGTKITHIGKNAHSTTIAKNISYGSSISTFRSCIHILTSAKKSKVYSQCDSLMLSKKTISLTLPEFNTNNHTSTIEHEATTSNINKDMLYYCKQRGLDKENSIMLIINGFCKQILTKLPLEFALEAKKLLSIRLEGVIG